MDLFEVTVVQRARPELGYLTSLAVGDDLIVAAGGTTSQAPTVLASSNARHFEARTTPRQLGLRDIVIDGDALWTCGEYGQLAVSRDRGESWKLIDTSTDACLFGLVVAEDGALWVCGNAGFFARVQDDRLERVDLGTSTRLAALYCLRDEVIAIGADGVIYRWRAGAVTRVETGATKPLTGLAITKRNTWLVTGDGGFIARSPDGQWFSRARSGVEVDLEAIAALDGRVVIVGDRGLILQSRDEGRTWQQIDTDDTTHLWSIEPFGTGALIGGDNGLVLKLAARGDRTWQDRVNVFGGARALDAVFARGPDGFVVGESVYSPLYGVALPPPITRADLKDLHIEPVSLDGFEARILRDQQDDLATSLTDAFCGTCRIGSQGNGDSYHLELYEWDGPQQVLHFDHDAHAFTGVVADSLDSFVFHAALLHAHEHHELSDQAYEAGLRELQSRVAPSLDARRRDTEFFFYRSRWITAVLDNTEMADIPTLFMADFNQIVPAEQLPARFEACEKVIPTALYSMWRAYLFDEPELPRYVELGRQHKAGLVRDAATLIDELLSGRNEVGTIHDMRARLAAFRALDLDPRRADARRIEAEARAVLDDARRKAVEAELESGSFAELAWRWLDDRVAHRALLAKLDGRDEISMVEELPALPDDERALVITRLAQTLSPELEAILVGSLVRNDDLAGALPDRAPVAEATEEEGELAPGWDAIDAALAPLYGGAEPHAHFGAIVPYSLGGKDPIHGLSVYLREDHFHIITYGFTDLFIKESDDEDVSGFGFELTMRVARRSDETTAPMWPLSFLQNLARYVFSTGNRFDVGHKMGLNGPMAEGTDTKISAIIFAKDPELGEPINSPFGSATFLQVVGITDDEYALAQEWITSGLIEILRGRNRLLLTDLARDSVLADPTVAAAVHALVEEEGSSEDMSFAGDMEIIRDQDGNTVGVKGAFDADQVFVTADAESDESDALDEDHVDDDTDDDDHDDAADVPDEVEPSYEDSRRHAMQMSAVGVDEDVDELDKAEGAPEPPFAPPEAFVKNLRDATEDRPRAKGTRPFRATDDDIDDDNIDDDGIDDDDVGHDDVDSGHDHERADRGRAIASLAADVLREQAKLGRLDPRGIDKLVPLLTVASRFEARRHAVVEILGAARARTAVDALIDIARTTKPDSIAKSDLLTATVAALGNIGDSAAVPVLTDIVTANTAQYDACRAAAVDALLACTRTPNVPVEALLTAVRERGDADTLPAMLFAIGRLGRQTPEVQARTKQALIDVDLSGEDPILLLAREGALVMLGESPSRDLKRLLHECLTALDYDHETTADKLRVALQVAELVPYVVDALDLTWLTTFSEPDIRARAHALLVRLGRPLAPALVHDRYSVRSLGDEDVTELIREARIVGRAALIAEAARRKLREAVPAIIDACHDVISRARHGAQNLLDPDTRILEAAVPFLRRHLDAQVISLFDRMLRHPNYHVKWELMQKPPVDDRLIAGMFHVLGERWGWQEQAAKAWLANFQGTPEYELERRRVPTPPPYVPDDPGETNDDDQDMN